MKHYSVLLKESLELLNLKSDGIYVDGTLGLGGHSQKILENLKDGCLYAFDKDEAAIKLAKERLKDFKNVTYIHDNFANMARYLDKKVDGILLDLGVSSMQFDEEERGFSYRFDARLDMRMDKSQSLDAYKIVNTYDLKELTRILKDYGEEPYAYKIAQSIVKKRVITTTFELVEAIKEALPSKVLSQKGHPAKKTFQALRIAVNGELDSLEGFLNSFDELLNEGGRLVIISFQSLEDRLVKHRFKELTTDNSDRKIPLAIKDIDRPKYRLLAKKGLRATKEELSENNRSHSAILRAIEKVRS